MTELKKRVITGAILIPLVLGSLILGSYYFLAFIVLFLIGGIYEFVNIRTIRFSLMFPLAFVLLIFLLWIFVFRQISLFYALIFAVFVPWIIYPFYYVRGVGVGVYFSVVLEAILLSVAGYTIYLTREYGFWVSLYFFVTIWYFDSACYFVGKKYGKRKLAQLVSPGKTWEGFIGGLISLIPYVVIVKLTGLPGLSDWKFLFISAYIISIIGQQGDLAESALKREAGLKDSSNIFPGHGGVLDRTDSLVAAAPFYLLMIHWLWK